MFSRATPLLLLVLVPFLSLATQRPSTPPTTDPPSVSINQASISLSSSLSELRRQAGVRVVDETSRQNPTISLKLQDATFWQALDAIAKAVRARVALGTGARPLALVDASPTDRDPPTAFSGAFRVRLTRLAAVRDLDTNRSSLTATLEVAWVPALLPLFLDTDVQGLRVVGGDGKPLKLDSQGGSLAAIDGRTSTTLDLSLPGVPRAMADLTSFQGKLLVVAPSKMLTFRFDADLKAMQEALPGGALRRLEQDDVTCRIVKIVAERDRWSLQMALDYKHDGRPLESFQAGSLVANNDLVLVSRDGKRRLTRTSYVIDAVGSRRALVTYHFRDAPARRLGRLDDWRPVYTAPAKIVDVIVPFSFKKVPLP